LLGINVGRYTVAAFVFSGVFSAVGGVMCALVSEVANTGSRFNGVELSAIAISVLGGTMLSGGYFSAPSILAAAIAWEVLGEIMTAREVPRLIGADGVDHKPLSMATFAILVLVFVVMCRNRIKRLTSSVLVAEPEAEVRTHL